MASAALRCFHLVSALAPVIFACSSRPPAAPAPAPAPAPTATDRPCTQIGCVNGLHLTFVPDAGWPAGRYVFRIEADGASQTCEGALPLPACDTPGLRCSGSPIATIGESGCALPAAQHGFAGVMIQATPAQVELSAERDGQPLFQKTFAPAYVSSRPNGPHCEPVCTSASDTVAVVFP